MPPDRNAAEFARETFKQLAMRRLPPTPENYRTIYDEIAGVRSPAPFPESPLRQILRILPGQTPAQKRLLQQFEAAIEQSSWAELQRTIVAYANLGLGLSAAGPAPAPAPAEAPAAAPVVTGIETAAVDVAAALPGQVLEQVARLIEHVAPAASADDPRVSEQAGEVVRALRQPQPDMAALKVLLANFGFRLSFATEAQTAIRSGLLHALHELFRNIAVLSADDKWLQGQAEALLAAATPPLELRKLDDLHARLRDVIFKQTETRSRTVEAQEQMKEMLTAFIDRLSSMTEKSGVYHDKIEGCAERLGSAHSIEEIAPVLQEVITATRAMALDSRMTHDDLQTIRQRSEQAQEDVGKLRMALEKASAEARHDPLTGALNRKGMDEALEREIARARRAGAADGLAIAPLCVALLDIDNFKLLNDRIGHDGGDAALVHLARVAREAMRPQDVLARYGGEEFVVLLPDTPVDAGVEAMQRLQRELTRRFFMQNNDKVLITFSAGVAQVAGHEDPFDAIKRADQAMYLAKRSGKNRVLRG
ncbi:GGDEF domain-containing protein [Xylophilus sp. GOD-11R]|uniref:GGDEF domain-containing protein n=1 Tax=Xylophilus sp. GOD-11R TaxID=3089814 RepID=UPI00298D3D67|nr:GGDEF domain-containing protein [Xylophilus sp. GOD-11R]WPB55247.1 GGDEF domain-containing protein [Xylophilus sp. GOD-11R]